MFRYLPDVLFFGMIAMGLLAIIVAIAMIAGLIVDQRRKARAAGYASLGAYLRAAPRTDQERRDAADLALKGAAICLLAVIFPPVLLVGLFPLFYGGRKLVFASLGLGLTDDGERTPPGA